MFAGKNQASQHPTAFGSMLQASTYGMVIPVIYGITQSPLLAIWAQNLRQGGSTKKFKQMKKGITAYCENIDFLLGKNPIQGVLRVWNNGAIYPLAFPKYSVSITAGSSGAIAIPDSNFYAVLGVTLTQNYSETFNDYGAPGPSSLSGSFEIPFWNQLFAGPDPTGSSDPRNFPYRYRWEPGYGAAIYLDDLPYGSIPSGTLNIYYAQLTSATKHQPPISRLRLSFESILGSGDEYNGYTSEQILYPWYAGLGSPDIDLGAMGAIPAIKAEVQGKWGFTAQGDCDFVDIIEDVVKSGITQASMGGGINFGPAEHGTGSYDLPGTIQKKLATSNNASGLPPMLYDLPNTQGNVLVCVATGQGALSIASSNGETWTPLFSGSPRFQLWYATAVGGTNTVTVSGAGQPSEVAIFEIGGVGQASLAIDNGATFWGVISGTPSGVLTKNFSASIGAPYTIDGRWTNFALIDKLPSDAVIQGIYPVTTARWLDPNHMFANIYWGDSSGTTNVSPPSSYTELHGGSMGTDVAAVAASGFIGGNISASVPDQLISPYPSADEIDFQNVGFAVLYASATPPAGSPPIPDPFTPPAGQYFAWMLPFQFSQTGFFYNPNPPGLFSPSGLQEANFTVCTFTPVSAGTPGAVLVHSSDGGISIDSSATGLSSAALTSACTPGWPAYLLAVPFYGGSDSPASAQVAKWKALTPANLYNKALATFQAHGKIIRNPGTFSFTAPGTDATAVGMIGVRWTDAPTFARPSGDFIDPASMELTRAQCRAGGLFGSLSMTAQKSASQWVNELCEAADCWPVFSGFRLYLKPRSEVSAVGNGAVYVAPTSIGPVADLDADNGDFIELIKAPRKARTDTDTVLQMQHLSRAANYAQVITAEPDAAGIAMYGVRKKDPITNNAVQDVAIARSILSIMVRRRNYVENQSYTFTLNQRWAFLDATDLVTITDRAQGIVKLPVRLVSWEENENYEIACAAEPFVYGIHAPQALPATTPSPYSGSGAVNQSAGNVNPPVIFEPVSRLYSGTRAQLWMVISSPAANYGGAQVYVSTDGGVSYNPLGDPVVGNSITGETTADWPAAADPDTANDLPVDLTESNGTLDSYAVSDEDNFVYPCYVQGQQLPVDMNTTLIALVNGEVFQMNGSTIAEAAFGYELMTYAVANLTAASKYTLKATGSGNHLRRDVFNAPDNAGMGVDHPSGSRWAFLSPAGTGILKVDMDAVWVGKTLWFKVLSFNEFGAAAQSLTDPGIVAYNYSPTGVPSTV